MNGNFFYIEPGPRAPQHALEAHLISVATAWCQGQSAKPIVSTEDFQKRLESEAAWFCKDNPEYDPLTITIGRYDETMLFIKPAGRDIRATVTIRLIEAPALIEFS